MTSSRLDVPSWRKAGRLQGDEMAIANFILRREKMPMIDTIVEVVPIKSRYHVELTAFTPGHWWREYHGEDILAVELAPAELSP